MMRSFSATVFLAAASLLALAACEETVDPILDSSRDFTLWGTLDMARDTQFVRVIPIRETLANDVPDRLPVTFTSEHVDDGTVIPWRDSLLTFPDGSRGHVFFAPLRIRSGHTYRLALQPDGSDLVTSAVTTVPATPRPRVQPPLISGGIGGAIGQGTQQVLWDGVADQPFRIELWYRFLPAEGGPFQDVRLPYVPRNEPAGPAQWAVTLDLTRDRRTLDTLVVVDQTPLVSLGLELTLLDDAFVPPGGAFDPEVLVQPGTLSNVENGLGFVGSVGRFPVEWALSEDEAERLNYLTLEDVFGASAADVLARLRRAPSLRPHPGRHPRFQ